MFLNKHRFLFFMFQKFARASLRMFLNFRRNFVKSIVFQEQVLHFFRKFQGKSRFGAKHIQHVSMIFFCLGNQMHFGFLGEKTKSMVFFLFVSCQNLQDSIHFLLTFNRILFNSCQNIIGFYSFPITFEQDSIHFLLKSNRILLLELIRFFKFNRILSFHKRKKELCCLIWKEFQCWSNIHTYQQAKQHDVMRTCILSTCSLHTHI